MRGGAASWNSHTSAAVLEERLLDDATTYCSLEYWIWELSCRLVDRDFLVLAKVGNCLVADYVCNKYLHT